MIEISVLKALPFHKVFLWSGSAGVAAIFGTGIVCAGFILARLYSNSTKQLIVKTIAFSLLVALFYGLVAFAGCMVLLGGALKDL